MEEFKRKGTFASPYFVLTLFEELVATKNLVLIRGDVLDMKISDSEAKFVMEQLLQTYLNPELYTELAYKFNHAPNEFSYEYFKNKFMLSDH